MGAVWDLIKEFGSAVLSGISYGNDMIRNYENEYDYYDDEELVREGEVMLARVNRSSSVEASYRLQAILNVLKSRGYDV